MAAPFIGEAVFSATLQVLFDRMASREVVNFIRGKKLNNGLLKKLKIKLLSVSAVINDAEEKQFTSPQVKEWLHELKDAVQDAEDLLDEIATEALRCKLEAESGSRKRDRTGQVRNLISTFLNLFDREIEQKIEEILDRLEYIAQQKDVLGLKAGIGEKLLSKRIPTTSLVEESDVYGRDADRDAIINFLLSDDVGGSKIGVIPIVGMGGIGKTTLAQLVFNDDRVKEHFDFKAWVCVSEDFDVFRVTKTIIEAFSSHSSDIKDLNLLQLSLKEKLTGKKFLLVLDDLWNESYTDWEALSRPLSSGAQGSKVIVTTRSKSVANAVRAISIHDLNLLADEACWSLFAKQAFENENSNEHQSLEVIGKEIVKKCKGLPLALKTLGSLLRFNPDVQEWNKILNCEIWELSDDKSKILPALRLSYLYLPSHLKRCFVYCSIFPKDYRLEKEQLIQLWMAEGFLECSKRKKRMEEIGNEYFDELVSRAFFQRSSGENSLFVMHDLVNDLAKFLSGECCFRMEDDDAHQISEKTRHFSYIMAQDSFPKLDTICNAKGLHTFLPINWNFPYYQFYLANRASLDPLLKLSCLRVLCFFNYHNINELPDAIGTLKLLRYLDVSNTNIVRLPESITTLYNLQTLKLAFCYYLKKLPEEMHKLINLRYVDIFGNDSLEEMPAQVSKLTDLQRLSTFIVGQENGVKIGELGKLPNLRGTLHIKKVRNVTNAMDASEAKLKDKKYLEELKLDYNGTNTGDSLLERNILEKLKPHTNLKDLHIEDFAGTRFPDWLGGHSFCNMISLRLQNCENCCMLPPLGQLPSLKDLNIYGFDGVVTVGPEFYGNGSFVTKPFPSLEKLSFSNMSAWQEWCSFGFEDEESRPFPRLLQLEIDDCKQLTSLLPSAPAICELYNDSWSLGCLPTTLKSLRISNCEKLKFPVQIINSCDTLQSFPLDIFPNLNSLSIENCKNLESLLASEGAHQDLTSITNLSISECPNFVSFPKGGLPASKLTNFKVSGCNKLKSLPERMHTLLPSLRDLSIEDCPELDSFPEGGLPSNLSSLYIRGSCDKLIAHRMNWHLQSLHSLTSFQIVGKLENVESFPEEGLLPSTLTHLVIWYLTCLKTLDVKGLQLLTSLKSLTIRVCPNLQSMPEEGLPTSLTDLNINNCPLLKERCQREKGEDWPKIAHIPRIIIL